MVKIIDNLIEDNPYYLICYPIYDTYFKSKHISKIIARLEYWFKKSKYKTGFFKFLEPCKHRCYKPGKSWTEDIGLSRRIFNLAFTLIGQSYKSKADFLAQKDQFKGKLYARYYDRRTNQMYFIRNHQLADNFFDKFEQKKPHSEDSLLLKNVEVTSSNKISINSEKRRSWKDENCHSFNTKTNIQINSSLDKQLAQSSSNTEDEKNIKKMIGIWKQIIGEKCVPEYSRALLKNLKKVFENFFDGCLEKWKAYCQKIASSKFLMGEIEGRKYKLWFFTAIKTEIIQRILQDGYTFGDRFTNVTELNNQLSKNEAIEFINQKKCQMLQQFHHYLLKQEGLFNYNNWFKDLQPDLNGNQKVIIKVKNNFLRNSLQNRFWQLLNHAAEIGFKSSNGCQIIC